MNDTCQTTASNGDSFFSEVEDSGCQPSDVPLARNATPGSGIVLWLRAFCGSPSQVFRISARCTGPFRAGADSVGACPCGMVLFPA